MTESFMPRYSGGYGSRRKTSPTGPFLRHAGSEEPTPASYRMPAQEAKSLDWSLRLKPLVDFDQGSFANAGYLDGAGAGDQGHENGGRVAGIGSPRPAGREFLTGFFFLIGGGECGKFVDSAWAPIV